MPTVRNTLGDGTQVALLTVAIIDKLAIGKGPVSISELAKEIGTSKSRVHRHLQTLLEAGIAVRLEPSGQYGIGPRLIGIGQAVSQRYDLAHVATSVIYDLRERFGHSVILSRIEYQGVEVLKSISGKSPIILEIRPGTVLPFHSSAQGKIAMAFARPAMIDPDTPLALARAAYDQERPGELDAVKNAGYAVAQMREGLSGAAAPVFGPAGQLVGTVAFLNTISEIGHSIDTVTIDALRSAAETLSKNMGMPVNFQPD